MTNARFVTCGFARVESYTFHDDPRPSLWQWRALANSSHIDRLHPQAAKSNE